jgi:signal transduction histidine kinase
MTRVLSLLSAGTLMIGFSAGAGAQELATPEEAEAMFDRAMAYVDENGLEAAREAFNDPDGEFVYKDLYVFCITYDGIRTVFGINPDHVGRDVMHLQDREGRPIVPGMIEVSQSGERGVFEYTWPNPVTNMIGPKYSFIEEVGPDEFCGLGYYE